MLRAAGATGGRRTAALAGIALAWCAPAHAGNFDTFYLGNEAAMQAGAATASARRGSAIWYNPAGLAQLDHSSIDANVTAFSLSLGQNIDLDSNLPGAEFTRLKSTSFSVVPASLSYARQLSFAGAGLALFVPNQQTQVLRTRLRAPAAEGASYELSLDASSVVQEYYAGPALGFSLGPHVDLGFALFASFFTELTQATFVLLGATSDAAAGSFGHTNTDQQMFGVQPVAGVQVHLGKVWHAGLVVRSPTLRIYRQSQNIDLLWLDDGSARPMLDSTFADTTGFSSTLLAPLRVHLGLAREIGAGQIAAEASYRAPLRNAGVQLDQHAVFNGRLGGQAELNDTLALGGGVFTDLSADRLSDDDADGRSIDYYGLSFGVQLDTPYGIISRKRETLEQPRPLIFRTTLVLSYLLGVGQLQRLEFGSDGNGGLAAESRSQDVVEHQLVLNFGATLLD